mmetsp:Transcript_20571/g.42982  ORF Transcript_20571/g.42982 Transcript_20571/m.42982 type:complete len:230 (-) Transcript_20571:789-1478(-)
MRPGRSRPQAEPTDAFPCLRSSGAPQGTPLRSETNQRRDRHLRGAVPGTEQRGPGRRQHDAFRLRHRRNGLGHPGWVPGVLGFRQLHARPADTRAGGQHTPRGRDRAGILEGWIRSGENLALPQEQANHLLVCDRGRRDPPRCLPNPRRMHGKWNERGGRRYSKDHRQRRRLHRPLVWFPECRRSRTGCDPIRQDRGYLQHAERCWHRQAHGALRRVHRGTRHDGVWRR